MLKFVKNLHILYLVLFCLSLAVSTEASILLAIFYVVFLRLKIEFNFNKLKIVIFNSIFYLLYYIFYREDFIIGLIFPIYLITIFVNLRSIIPKLPPLALYITMGILVSSIWSYVLLIFPNQSPEWLQAITTATKSKDGRIYSPQDSSNEWIAFDLALQGSGEIQFEVNLRGSEAFTIGTFVNKTNASQGWKQEISQSCKVKTTWTRCIFNIRLNSRAYVSAFLGGNGTWKLGSPNLEIGQTSLKTIQSPQFWEYFIPQNRAKGNSFNENSFGAWFVVVGLIALFLNRRLFWWIVAFVFTLFCIFLSGSQGALAAFVVGILTFYFFKSPRQKILLTAFFLVASIVFTFRFVYTAQLAAISITLNVQTQLTTRAIRPVPTDSVQSRLGIWRLAIKAWLETPQTFLIGTGDLSAAMKIQYDLQAQRFGIVKEDLTHAHNLWIQMAAETGLVGLVVMIWLWWWVVWNAWKRQDASAFALLAAIFVINTVDHLFFYAPVHLAFWIAAVGFKPSSPENLLETLPAKT